MSSQGLRDELTLQSMHLLPYGLTDPFFVPDWPGFMYGAARARAVRSLFSPILRVLEEGWNGSGAATVESFWTCQLSGKNAGQANRGEGKWTRAGAERADTSGFEQARAYLLALLAHHGAPEPRPFGTEVVRSSRRACRPRIDVV
jgi:hypothetical protein